MAESGAGIRVKVFATLRKLIPAETDVPAAGPMAIRDIIAGLGLPPEKVTVIFLNGRHATEEETAAPGDTLSLFPPVGGG